jgi:energy-converting hydrogenase Eha subunit E
MEDDKLINRSCGVLMGVIGILGCISVLPVVKKPVRDSLQLSMSGIGIVLSLFTIISKATEQKQQV